MHLAGARVFTSDQWGDYLIYSGWPLQKVFIDGRSDFYGALLGSDYLSLAEGRPGWQSLFQKYDFDAVLIPRTWPLAALLERDPAWRRLGQTRWRCYTGEPGLPPPPNQIAQTRPIER